MGNLAPEKMDPFPTNTHMPGRDVLIEMIKAQLDQDASDEDLRRDVFLSLAVTIPPRPRARIRGGLGPLLARARLCGTGSRRGSASVCPAPVQIGGLQTRLHDDHDNDETDVAVELERTIGVISTLLVLGC